MLTFTTQYPCPTVFLAGGGDGNWGLCVMEALSVLTGEWISNPKPLMEWDGQKYTELARPYVNVSSVHPALRDLLVSANDTLGAPDLSGEDRADGLWPILPSVMDTARLTAGERLPDYPTSIEAFRYNYLQGFPIQTWAADLGEELTNGPWTTPPTILRSYAWRASSPEKVWERTLIATKRAIEVFWEVHPGELPRTEFTTMEVFRLTEYLDEHPNPYTIRRDRKVSAVA